jgi:hypothetical protein
MTVKAQNTLDSLNTELKIDMTSYSLELPPSWKIKSGCQEDQCTAVSPTDTINGYDTYIESVNLTVNKLSSASYTAEKYANFSISYLPKVVSEFELMDKTKLNSKSYRITYTGVKNNLRQTWRQYYHVRNSKVYIVTFSAEQRKYRFYKDDMEPYLASFKFK